LNRKTGKLIPFGVDANGVAFQESKPISFGEESFNVPLIRKNQITEN
jgi:hypothetical protein